MYYLKVIDKTNNQILYKIGISKKETPKYRIRSLRSSALRNSNIVLDIEILHYKQYELYTAFCLEQKFYRNIKILENIQHILQSYLQTIFMNI